MSDVLNMAMAAVREMTTNFEGKRVKTEQQVIQLQTTVSDLARQVQDLQVQIAMMRAKDIGNGATSGNND